MLYTHKLYNVYPYSAAAYSVGVLCTYMHALQGSSVLTIEGIIYNLCMCNCQLVYYNQYNVDIVYPSTCI